MKPVTRRQNKNKNITTTYIATIKDMENKPSVAQPRGFVYKIVCCDCILFAMDRQQGPETWKKPFLEGWHSPRDKNLGNEHTDVPNMYEKLARC